ncbi:velum formation- protein [Lecanicillium sp. MT-2017a]|nr:velum formation- protein [Lecanicillium sp. MT-2017a]
MATPMAPSAAVPRENIQRIHRITKENRSLWYQLTVLQQPERARACGSGMKANSDRRPVDPPPVVELRIIEGPSVEQGKDITFDYNANFFLFATLEQARPMAHGRLQTAAVGNPPVLTGVPASGMAYLDRPNEAGYFIFPDLSVRHEGYFVLSFSLYETTKDAKDADHDSPDDECTPGVDWRMEIKTHPFNVYSAKKFPGLMESTTLSKIVADQGCRVRIRRDVRMRKRESKAGNGYDRRDAAEYSGRKPSMPAPSSGDPNAIRARSLSNASEHRIPYMPDHQRRPSAADSYSSPLAPRPPYDHSQPRSNLAFGEHPPAPVLAPQHATHRSYPTPLAPISPATPYGAHQASYPESEPSYGHRSLASTPQPCPSPSLSIKHEPYEPKTHAYMPPSPSSFAHTEHHSRSESLSSYPPTPTYTTRRPTLPQTSLAPLKIASLVSPLPPIEAQTEPPPAPPVIPTGGKRKHDVVFSQSSRSLCNGERQMDPHYRPSQHGITSDTDSGMYSRANGQVGVVQFNTYQQE